MTTVSSPGRESTQSDEAEIRRVVQLYADGFGAGGTGMFEEAFHENAWIFFTEADGTLRAWPLGPATFREWASDSSATIRVLKVTRSGDVANVMLIWRGGGSENTWLDLHNLLRINGVWKITNKTATHISNAGDVPST